MVDGLPPSPGSKVYSFVEAIPHVECRGPGNFFGVCGGMYVCIYVYTHIHTGPRTLKPTIYVYTYIYIKRHSRIHGQSLRTLKPTKSWSRQVQAGFAEAKGHMDVVVSQLGQISGGREVGDAGVIGGC